MLAGVREVLADLDGHPASSPVLTGNIEAGAHAKLAHYGLDRVLSGRAAPSASSPGERAEIARRALALIDGSAAYVIGDTPAGRRVRQGDRRRGRSRSPPAPTTPRSSRSHEPGRFSSASPSRTSSGASSRWTSRLQRMPGPFDHFRDAVDRFEELVASQQPFEPRHYDDDYFASDWRDEGNRYELELAAASRRATRS